MDGVRDWKDKMAEDWSGVTHLKGSRREARALETEVVAEAGRWEGERETL